MVKHTEGKPFNNGDPIASSSYFLNRPLPAGLEGLAELSLDLRPTPCGVRLLGEIGKGRQVHSFEINTKYMVAKISTTLPHEFFLMAFPLA